MNKSITRLKKPFLITTGIIATIFVVIILFISPIAKYLVENYSVKYTGRKITTGWVYVNPFTGFVHINHLKIYEPPLKPSTGVPDSVFFEAQGVSANFAMFKLLSNTIEITKITLTKPKGIITQSKEIFNFSDIIKKFTPKKASVKTTQSHFAILNISIKDGTFYYNETIIPVHYFIKGVNIESTGIRADVDTFSVKYNFTSGPGNGVAKGNFTLNIRNLDYSINTSILNYDLKFIEQYLKDLTNYGYFNAYLDANIQATGNLKETENINAKGFLAMNNFHFGKDTLNDYASFQKLALGIIDLNPKAHKYIFDSIKLDQPYFKYERYEYLDNLQTMFGKGGANIATAKANPEKFNLVLEIANYVKILAKNFFRSNYKINNLSINKGRFIYNDYSLIETFSVEANPLSVQANSIDKDQKRVEIFLKSGIEPFGNASVSLSINPNDSGDFDIQYNLQKLPAALFNPYLLTYTSFPLDRGTLALNGTWHVNNGEIKSDNHLVIIDPRISNRLKNKETKWLPAPLFMYFIRENGNVIDYSIPITGNLKNPKFHLNDLLVDIMGNIFVKPPTTAYRIEIRKTENEIEKSLSLKWEMRQVILNKHQKKFITNLVDFLDQNPQDTISIYPIQYAEKEMEYLLFFEAKKKYFLTAHKSKTTINEDDSLMLDKMSMKNPAFVEYLNTTVNDSLLFTAQDKCIRLIGLPLLQSKFNQIKISRESAFRELFNKKALNSRVKIQPSQNSIPYNGFSYYKIVYKGTYPKDLLKAYEQMEEFNSEVPRKKFTKTRKENKNIRNM